MSAGNINKDSIFSIHPVGYVQASESDGQFAIKVFPEYCAALKKLDQFSHVVIFWWADRHDIPHDSNITVANLPYAEGIEAGVFACRSEYRPNPIAMTVMQILHIDEKNGLILLPWIDAFDGTPVIDLKPYMPVSDRIRDVKVADWLKDWPLWMEEAGEYFSTHQTNFG